MAWENICKPEIPNSQGVQLYWNWEGLIYELQPCWKHWRPKFLPLWVHNTPLRAKTTPQEGIHGVLIAPSFYLETDPMPGQLPFSTIFSNSVLLHNRCVGHWWEASCWFISRLVRHALWGEINISEICAFFDIFVFIVTINFNNQNFIKDHTYSIDFGQRASTP